MQKTPYEVVRSISAPSPCHVCGHEMSRNYLSETEWCVNIGCQIPLVRFSIPYDVKHVRAKEV